jgi:hypothetical protein
MCRAVSAGLIALGAVLCLPTAASAVSGAYDFGVASSVPASGYTLDRGLAFSAARGVGWIRQDSVSSATKVSLDVSGNGRQRSGVADARSASFVHMQFADADGGGAGTKTPAAWQVTVPNGSYTVTVGVGDGSYYDSTDVINAEGSPLLAAFRPTASKPFASVTKTVIVKDGALTVDAKGGVNTKIGYLTFAPTVAAVDPGFFGVNGQYVFGDDQAAVARHLGQIASHHLGVVRRDLSWEAVEPKSGGGYAWGFYDRLAAAMAKAKLRWLPVLMQAPVWAAATPSAVNSAPAASKMSTYLAWVKAVVRRYGRGGSFWAANPSLVAAPITTYEIWNEENATYWWGSTARAPEEYADLYVATRSAIRGIDAAAKAVVGGIAPTAKNAIWPTQFLQRMVARAPGLKGNVDGVAFHPYATDISYVYELIHDFRGDVDQRLGASVPLYITETGWSTTDVSTAVQGANISRLARELPRSDCNIAQLDLFTWVAKGSGDTARNMGFALASPTAGLKPAGTAYAGAATLMTGHGSTAAPAATIKICH